MEVRERKASNYQSEAMIGAVIRNMNREDQDWKCASVKRVIIRAKR